MGTLTFAAISNARTARIALNSAIVERNRAQQEKARAAPEEPARGGGATQHDARAETPCVACGKQIDVGSAFCRHCGKQQQRSCAQCKTPASADATFCAKCGNKLS